MKKITFLKTIFTLIVCGFFSMTYAGTTNLPVNGGTIYLSSTGLDTNDGFSAATAVKTFSKAQDLASSGETIMVSGMIEFDSEVTLTKNLIIKGTSSATDGFDGKNLNRLINSGGFNLSIMDLKITGGNGTGNGGAMVLTGGTITFTRVIFKGNTTDTRGGAISIEPTTALTLNFNNTVFINNTSTTEGAAYNYIDAAGTANTITFTNCAIISNEATTTGAGGYVNNASGSLQLSYINTTVAKNHSVGANSAALFIGNLQAASNFVMTNCTVTENYVSTGTGTAGSGIRVASAVTTNGGKVKIYNSILENNYIDLSSIGTATSNYTTDLAWQSEGFTPGTNFIFEKSFLGKPGSPTKAAWVTAIANAAADTSLATKINYVNASSGNVTESYLAKFAAFDATTNSYALTDDSGVLIDKGDASKLTSLTPSVTTDQLGKTRPATECSIGAVEKKPVLGAKKFEKNDTVTVFRNSSNQIVVTDTDIDAKASISIYNVLGQMVYKTQSTGVVTTIEKSFNSGLYLVSVSKGGAAITKKVVLN
jgi:hypothetical protein